MMMSIEQLAELGIFTVKHAGMAMDGDGGMSISPLAGLNREGSSSCVMIMVGDSEMWKAIRTAIMDHAEKVGNPITEEQMKSMESQL